ncbi:hypothetical protein IG631_15831 [Alternaria alternata]|nr:hypothetical protein IG631_15831 [Alternaria alternata]
MSASHAVSTPSRAHPLLQRFPQIQRFVPINSQVPQRKRSTKISPVACIVCSRVRLNAGIEHPAFISTFSRPVFCLYTLPVIWGRKQEIVCACSGNWGS